MSVEDSIPPSAPPADPIDSLDFNIAGLTQSTDSAEVRRILGAPDSIIVAPNPVGDGMLTSWAFPGLNVHYYGGNRVALVDVTGPDYSTRRGISVGDSAAHVLASYGPQEGDVPTNWVYAEPADMERLHLIHFYFSGDVVERIILGWALDRHMCPTATAVAHVV